MNLDFAIDTNIAIYALSEGPKCGLAFELLKAGPSVSIQLLNEFTNVSLRKTKLPWNEIDEGISVIISLAGNVRYMDMETNILGRIVAQRYSIGIYDSLIVAASLLDGCSALYSEDMHHGLVINDQLTIINPFLEMR